MADNTQLNLGAGGDLTRSVDKSGVKTTVVTLDVGGASAESLVAGALPVGGLVSDVPESYLVGVTQPLSLTTDGRLRTNVVPANVDMNLFSFSLGQSPSTDPTGFDYCLTSAPWPT